MDNRNQETPTIRATYDNVPDHSDLRGFSYRGPDSEEHPERNDKFEMASAKDDDNDKDAKEIKAAASDDEETDDETDLDARANGGPQNIDIDEDDNDDVLEEVRGGLRADVPDDIEYDVTDADARRKVS